MTPAKKHYEPDMCDCRMVIHTQEATCYVMDTCCRNMAEGQREKIDADIAHIYRQSILNRRSNNFEG